MVCDSFVTPWTVACQSPLAMGFSKKEYWSRLPFPLLWDLPDPGIEPMFPALAGRFFTTEPPGQPYFLYSVKNSAAMNILTHSYLWPWVRVSLGCLGLDQLYQRVFNMITNCVIVHLLSCLTLSNPKDCSTPGYPILHYLPQFAQTNVHWVSDTI